jgi:threonyl-tRNA synthetase
MLLHTSVSGGIDRCVCALLEKEAQAMNHGRKAMLPFWLSPTQVRLIPVGDEFVEECYRLAKEINGRADVDDREVSVSKRIREAEKEWVPIIIVYGKKEQQGTFNPRCRFTCPDILSLSDLNKLLEQKLHGFPEHPLTLPLLLSHRPNFR